MIDLDERQLADRQKFREALTAANPWKLPSPCFPSDRYALWTESKNRSGWDYSQESIETLRRMRKQASEDCDAQLGRGKYAAMEWSGLNKINDELGVRENA